MSSEKPVIVIIHGGFHLPVHYDKLIKGLGAKGYEAHCPRHPSSQPVRPPTSHLAEDTDNMRSYVEKLVNQGRRVIAVMHSYGGQVGSNALHGLGEKARSEQGLQGGVSNLIYMCANMLPENTSAIDKVEEMGNMDLMPLVFDIAEDKTVVVRDPKLILLGDGGDYTEEELETYLARLIRWNGQPMSDPITHAAWREIPITYIYCLTDNTIPIHYQKSMVELVEKEGREVRTFEIATGHCPNFTAAKDVVEIIDKVAQ